MEDRQFGRIRFVCGDNNGKYPFNHSLYLQGDRSRVIIDPACSLEKLTRLKDEGVDYVWLSHWHEDHIRYIDLFENHSLQISRRDFPPLTDINIFLDWYDIKIPQERSNWKRIILEVFNFRPRCEANFLEDGATVDLGGLTVQVLPTPGHTPGHLSFFFPEEGLLFLGDYDLTSFGPWYGDVYSDIDETIKSIHKLKAVPARKWFASHDTGLFEENPGRLWDDYENVIYERENKLLAFLEKPKTIAEICAAWLIYGRPREPKEMYEFNERVLVRKHLEYLQRQDKIVSEDERYVKA
ncbi:MAG TPA: MBL fold metallo-hydrolase [Smithellaceae bacterium]|nr:MBL fold metallo-hydrolase [Smithellaceae bacterium]HPE06348.1 MBL fold metallo-hydrolase [Smithellaceae bacterium]